MRKDASALKPQLIALATLNLATIGVYGDTGFDPSRIDCSYATENIITFNVAEDFGDGRVSQRALYRAMNAAEIHWDTVDPNSNIVLEINSGEWEVDGNPALNISGLNSGRLENSGWLILKGNSLSDTRLTFSDIAARGFYGKDVNRLHVCNLHLTRAQETVTQGTVVGYLHGAVWADDTDPLTFGDQPLLKIGRLDESGMSSRFLVVELHDGFPRISDVYNHHFRQGRYTKRWRYTHSGIPYPVPGDEQQAWEQFQQLGNGRWVLGMRRDPGYEIGDTLAIKSKLAGEPIFIAGGDSVIVENVLLTRASRMLFRKGVDNILYRNVSIARHSKVGGKTPFLASAEGGAQVGQPNEGPLRNVVVEQMLTHGTGDDPLAAFDVLGLQVRNSSFHDSFARGILLDRTSDKPCINNTLVNRSPLLSQNTQFSWGCVEDSQPPPSVSELSASVQIDGVFLTWKSATVVDRDGFAIQRKEPGSGPIEIAVGVRKNQYLDISAEKGVAYEYIVVALDTSRNRSAPTAVKVPSGGLEK